MPSKARVVRSWMAISCLEESRRRNKRLNNQPLVADVVDAARCKSGQQLHTMCFSQVLSEQDSFILVPGRNVINIHCL
jgi:hypothetical protein